MVKLKRFRLDFDKTYTYVKSNLTNINTLSTELTEMINWKDGKFFAFLPENAANENIHAFDYYKITTDKNKVHTFVLNELINDPSLVCVFDDFSDEYEPGDTDPFFLNYCLFYQKELYLFITKKNASLPSINKCFFVSDAIWHSLCVLSKFDLINKKDKELTLSEIKNICLNATLVVVGAYDAEGYVMWESIENRHSSITELNDDERQD